MTREMTNRRTALRTGYNRYVDSALDATVTENVISSNIINRSYNSRLTIRTE